MSGHFVAPLAKMVLLPLLQQCAPDVHPSTLEAIIRIESRNDPWAIHVNRGPPAYAEASARQAAGGKPTDAKSAALLARTLIAKGYSIDMGLMQINSRNLGWLGLTVEDVFDPCTNIRAGATVLSKAYQRAARRHGPGGKALLAALSAYNTGSMTRGFRNGYVNRYLELLKETELLQRERLLHEALRAPTTIPLNPQRKEHSS